MLDCNDRNEANESALEVTEDELLNSENDDDDGGIAMIMGSDVEDELLNDDLAESSFTKCSEQKASEPEGTGRSVEEDIKEKSNELKESKTENTREEDVINISSALSEDEVVTPNKTTTKFTSKVGTEDSDVMTEIEMELSNDNTGNGKFDGEEIEADKDCSAIDVDKTSQDVDNSTVTKEVIMADAIKTEQEEESPKPSVSGEKDSDSVPSSTKCETENEVIDDEDDDDVIFEGITVGHSKNKEEKSHQQSVCTSETEKLVSSEEDCKKDDKEWKTVKEIEKDVAQETEEDDDVIFEKVVGPAEAQSKQICDTPTGKLNNCDETNHKTVTSSECAQSNSHLDKPSSSKSITNEQSVRKRPADAESGTGEDQAAKRSKLELNGQNVNSKISEQPNSIEVIDSDGETETETACKAKINMIKKAENTKVNEKCTVSGNGTGCGMKEKTITLTERVSLHLEVVHVL